MGLLRKAAHAAARDENQVPTAGTATATEDERADLPAASGTGARTGLLRKITERMETAQLAAAVELARAVEPPAAPSLFEPAVEASPTHEEAVLEEEPSTEPLPFQTVTEAPTATEAPAAEPIAPAEAIVDPQKLTLDILGSLKSLPDGVELPSQLFSLLIARLGIQKGALLLFDPLRMVYAPWASRGYDPTTTHRMRISLGASESWNALANGSPMLLTDPPALAAYQPYFSSRESSSVSRLLLVPFIAEEKLIAVLLVTDLASPFSDDQGLLQCLSQVSREGSNRVYAARASRLTDAGIVAARPDASPGDEASRFISALGTASPRILLLSLSLEDFSRSVTTAHEHLDPFRLHEDLTYFLGSFLADVGRIMAVRQGRFIVGLPEFNEKDLDLFLHQMMAFLHGLFGGNGAPGAPTGPRVLKSAVWPADGGEIRSLVDSLSG